MEIPNWDDVRVKLDKNEKINPLEQFVYNYDNADKDGSAEFISDLEKLTSFTLEEREKVIQETYRVWSANRVNGASMSMLMYGDVDSNLMKTFDNIMEKSINCERLVKVFKTI